MQTIKSALEEGVQEIVLTGVNTGDFGKGHQEGFIDLVSAIEALPDKIRVRISSIEPNLLNEEIIDLVAQSQKFMPHFHIPLQSGDDEMLKIMHRKYDTDLYRNRIEYIKAKMPHACIGVDVIVGYRDESEAHFQNSLNFVQSLPISYLHVFTYSERDNTRALKSEHFVPIEERRKRNEAFRKISVEKKKNFYKSFIGQEREILFEHAENDGFMYGYTDNYIRCRTPYRAEWVGTLQKISLNNLNNLVVFDL
jgi:threonylcarbamoyladenosine tRNA methylthiotransferase MtaB